MYQVEFELDLHKFAVIKLAFFVFFLSNNIWRKQHWGFRVGCIHLVFKYRCDKVATK